MLCNYLIHECSFYDNDGTFWEFLKLITPIAAAILAALMPFWIAKKRERNKEYRNLQNLEHYFYLLIDNLINKTVKQIINIDSFLKNLRAPGFKDMHLKLETGFLFEKINKISKDTNIYKIFVHGKDKHSDEARNSLITVYNALEGIEQHVNSHKGYLERFNSKFNQFEDKWNKNAESFLRRFEKDMTEFKTNPPEEELASFYQKLDTIIFNWQELKTTDISLTKEKLMEPARELSAKYEQPFYLDNIMPCIAAYNDMINLLENYDKIFSSVRDNLDEHKTIIESELSTLRSIPLKEAKEWV